jgi:adenine-specific DNA-methyltransferase
MRYIGSKASTVQRVYELVSERIPAGRFCDAFGGIGVVGSYFKERGYSVWSGDILTFAHYFQIARIERDRTPSFRKLRHALGLKCSGEVPDILNTVKWRNGWFVREYCEKRRFFTRANAGRIEASRHRIAQWSGKGWVSDTERAVLLASLINSMDSVANTAGTYYAYLKNWHRKALRPYHFKLIQAATGNSDCHAFLGDARLLVAQQDFDILYLDPPHNERCYTGYYHLPETLALEQTPLIHGKSGIPDTIRPTSAFNKLDDAREAIEGLLRSARFRLLVFHYSDNGLVSPNALRRILDSHGKVEEFTLDSKGYTTLRDARRVKHRVYLVSHD